MDKISKGLNPAQAEAVNTLGGPLLILAGAGSGKTKTLTHRIANLISHGIDPHRILAVTFTNKAAREMRDRLWQLLQHDTPSTPQDDQQPPRSFMPYMGTFHSIAVKILRIESAALGLDRNFVIYDVDDQIALIRRVIKDLNISNDKSLKPKTIQSIISSEKNQGNTPADYEARAFYPNQKQIAKIFHRYEEEKSKSAALDFDDLLLKELELFKTHPEIRQKWQDKFQHILIDEYQDTNQVQYNIVKLLVNSARNICVVGDDWQSIYSWRGADFTNILNFERDFPGAKVIKLEQNYRSTGCILAASQKIIHYNETRTDKDLFTELGDGDPVEVESLQDEAAEANFVARKILSLQNRYPDFSDFAVLYRTNAQSYPLEKAFIDLQIPYKIIGGVRFYDRKEVKDMLAILRLIVNQRDKISLTRVCSNVLSGIGEVSIRKILSAMDSISEAEVLNNPDLPAVINAAKARNSLLRLTNFLKKVNSSDNPSEIIQTAINYFDFQTLTNDGTLGGEERMRNLEVLSTQAYEYESLEDFLADATLMSSADESSSKNSVTLMTMHAAKGLEFPVVFIVGMEEGLFPGSRALDNQADLEEERRLAYVGMTRAMRNLFLTYAASRYSYGARSYNMPSRFLIELGYDPYQNASKTAGSLSLQDSFDDDFNIDESSLFDPFPEELPVWE
ncbi:UvrD-helicase domain-containing protein [Candidatus Saccharibacteria bacterium]|nr:UvrD-helicase domain-containing protein [Candidatus Saccharibacteria bacterium]